MAAKSEKVVFTGAEGQNLAARLDSPQGEPLGYALFAHCFTCSKDIFAASRIARGLAEQGIAVLRFDFTGLGASDGEFANTNFSSNIQDLLSAVAFLRRDYQAPALLVGHSLGGAAVLAAAGDVPECRAVATIGAPADPAHVAHNFGASQEEIERVGEAEVTLAGRKFTIKKQFLDDIASQRLENRISELKRALLIFHAPLDNTVGIDNASRIFIAAKHPKSFVSLDQADHLLSRHEDAAYVAQVLSAWAGRYIAASTTEARTRVESTEGTVVVRSSGAGRFTQDIEIGKHRLIADEPTSVSGGLDRGPSPYDLLLAGLGACTSMTLRLYAEHKKLSLDKVAVRLQHSKVHAADCADCETKDGKIDLVAREITITGDLTDAERQRLLEIADRCPVHRTLESEIKIKTALTAE
ncbi:bifunctional alpha/beta hydrolase/OsmC family protein [Limibacillus halophilus]|uniref:Putative redox protein n=1 Tax=Limibacillus halophilus TaxID=1579333 RepID=A0A839SSS3_9PROT|nr:alpha/beta fold hydrolase [Limibacillus halophilus]MBB3065522.1 putative redox protein [Limibacillus halophilus]